MTVAKYQHYVPRLHLRRFVSDAPKGMVWTYDKVQGSCRPLKPENTGGQTYFYSMEMQDGSRSDAVDLLLRDVEDRAEAPYRELLAGQIPTGRAREDFAVFLATLHLRSPGMIRCMAEMTGKLLASHLNEEWSTFERFEAFLDRMDAKLGTVTEHRREDYEFWRDTGGYKIGIDRTEGFSALNSAAEIAEILHGRSWYLLDAVGDYFITSDQPVERATPGHGEGAFTNPLTEVSFPLSPGRCLMITGTQLGAVRHLVGARDVAKLNDMRARYAERLIWSHVESEAIIAMTERHRGQRLEIGFSNDDALPEIEIARPKFRPS